MDDTNVCLQRGDLENDRSEETENEILEYSEREKYKIQRKKFLTWLNYLPALLASFVGKYFDANRRKTSP